MRRLALALLLAAGCAPANYAFDFDLTDPGARNVQKPGQRDVLEDADIKAEILVDATSFQAILLDLTNKTDGLVAVNWSGLLTVGPDGTQASIRPDAALGQIEPGGKVVARLVPFSLPAVGGAASGYDNSRWELVVPMVVRGQPREYRYHLVAHARKI